MKSIDLQSQGRPEIELTLSGQTWQIRRVVNATYQIYQELMNGASSAQQRFAELQNKLAAGDADDSAVMDMQKDLTEEIQRRQELTYQCVQSVLEANGYEFDRDWWEANSDRHEQHGFIAAALNKDMQGLGGTSKKKDQDDSAGPE